MAAPLVGTGRVVGHFRLEITAAGTPQPLSDATIVRISAGDAVAILAQGAPDNTDDITVGVDATVVNTEASRTGYSLAARDSVILGIVNEDSVFFDADVTGEAVVGLLFG